MGPPFFPYLLLILDRGSAGSSSVVGSNEAKGGGKALNLVGMGSLEGPFDSCSTSHWGSTPSASSVGCVEGSRGTTTSYMGIRSDVGPEFGPCLQRSHIGSATSWSMVGCWDVSGSGSSSIFGGILSDLFGAGFSSWSYLNYDLGSALYWSLVGKIDGFAGGGSLKITGPVLLSFAFLCFTFAGFSDLRVLYVVRDVIYSLFLANSDISMDDCKGVL